MENPVVEVAIPAYNAGKFILECLRSVLDQSYQNIRVLVSDNCSSDNTLELVKSIKDERLSIFCQSKNLGAHGNFNFLINQSSAELVKLFCADDVMMPGAIEAQVGTMLRYPGAAICSSNMLVTDEFLKPVSSGRFYQGVATFNDLIEECFSTLTNVVGGPSNHLFRGESLRENEFNPAFKYVSDMILALRVCHGGFYVNEGTCSYFYRRHAQSDTNVSCGESVQADDWARFLLDFGCEDLASLYSISDRLRSGNAVDEIRRKIRAQPLSRRFKGLAKRQLRKLLQKVGG